MIEIGEQRLIALPMANDPEGGRPATVSIINATRPGQPEQVALIVLPPDARFRPDTRALLTGDGRFGVVASSFNAPALFSFNVETGEVVSQLSLYGQPAAIALQDNAISRTVVVANPMANNILISKLDQQGQLSAVGAFSPSDARFDYSNEPVFSADGRKVYVAASKGDRLYIVDAENGVAEGSISISCPQRITVARDADGAEIIGVARLRNSSSGKPGGVTILAANKGQLTVKAEFTPPDGISLSQTNNVVFSSDASLAFIGSATGILLSFSTNTGELVACKVLGDELRSLVLSQSTRTLLAVRSTLIKDDIAVIDVDRLIEDKSEVRNLSALTPEIKRIISEGTYLHLLIEGTNFRRGSIVEFVKAGNVVFQQSPVRFTERQLSVIVPAKKIEEMGKFEIRVVTGTKITTDPATVEPLTLLSGNSAPQFRGTPEESLHYPRQA
jgi:outer membrane protein assembly factor BamB